MPANQRQIHHSPSYELAEVFSKAPALLATVPSQDWAALAGCNRQLRTFIHGSVQAVTVDRSSLLHCLKQVLPQLALIKLKPVFERDAWNYSLAQLEEQSCQAVVNFMSFKAGKRALAQLVQSKTQMPELEARQHFASGFSFLRGPAWQHVVRLYVEMVDHSWCTEVMLQLGQLDLPCMEDLKLCNNNLGSIAIQHLAKGAWPKLKHLDLSNNLIDEAAMRGLIQGNWPSLTSLNLGINRFLDAAALALIPETPNWVSLRKLHLLGIGLNVVAAHALAQLHDRLECVTLVSTDLQPSGLSQLALVSWPNLQTLHLSGNKFEAGAIAALALMSLPCLTHLDLSRNRIDAAAAIELTKGSLPHLVDLDLSNNRLNSAAMASLAKGHWPNLKCLSLNDNSISGVECLAHGDWPRLASLCLDNRAVSAPTWNALTLEFFALSATASGGKGHFSVYRDRRAMRAHNNHIWPRLRTVDFV